MKRKTENFCRLCGGTIPEGFLAHAMECSGARLRALEAVAKAAVMHSHAEVPYDPIDESRKCGICRALSRLSRASQPRGARRGK